MKRILLLIAVISLCETPRAFSANQNTNTPGRFYFVANGGVSWVGQLGFKDDSGTGMLKFDPGVRLDVAGGYQFTRWLGADLEIGLIFNAARATSLDGAAENSLYMMQVPIMANVICSIPLRSRLHPFLGAGAGAVSTSLENFDLLSNAHSGQDVTFGLQGFAGIHYEISPRMELGLEYKFMGTTEHKFESLGGTQTQSLSLSFSLRF
jgi:opacity protein-like surface antigen